jgi:hypothetical protein
MSNRSGFGAGFWLGTLVGGVVGGVIGASIVERKANRRIDEEVDNSAKRPFKSSRRRQIDRMEVSRQSLDDKISDLNNTIDAVRSSLGNVAGEAVEPLVNRLEQDSNS